MGLNEVMSGVVRSLTKSSDRKVAMTLGDTAPAAIATADTTAISPAASAVVADLAKVQNDIAQGIPQSSQYARLQNLTVSDVKATPRASDPQKLAFDFKATLNYQGMGDTGEFGPQSLPITGIYDPAMRSSMWSPEDMSGQTPTPFYRMLPDNS